MAIFLTNILLAALLSATPPEPGLYRNDILHYSFAYPAELKAETTSPTPSQPARPGSAGTCIDMPLLAEHDIDETKSELLTITDVDLKCLKDPSPVDLKVFASKTLTEGLEMIGTPTVVAPISYQVAGHDAVLGQGSVTGTQPGDTPVYAATTCVTIDRHFVCWTALSPSRARVTVLLSSTITFADHPPQPLASATLFSR